MSGRGLAAALCAVALAGCLGATAPPSHPSLVGRLDIATDVDACVEVLVLVLVDADHARRFLPPGFEPADAAGFLGSPVHAGRAIVSINAVRCESSAHEPGPAAFADLIVLVDPPEVHGARVEAAPRNAYLVHGYTTGAGLVEATDGTGFAVSRIAVDAELGPTPDGAAVMGMGVLADGRGELARFEVTAAPGAADTAASNQFQVTPSGLVVHAFAWEGAPLSAGRASCAARAGSLVAEVLGTTTCDGAEAFGMLLGPVDFKARLRYFPGAGVGGSAG